MPTIDLTKHPIKDFCQLIRMNPHYRLAVAEKETWEDVLRVIDSLGVTYTREQINHLKFIDWSL